MSLERSSHAKFQTFYSKDDFLTDFHHVWTWKPSWSCDLEHLYNHSLLQGEGIELPLIGLVVYFPFWFPVILGLSVQFLFFHCLFFTFTLHERDSHLDHVTIKIISPFKGRLHIIYLGLVKQRKIYLKGQTDEGQQNQTGDAYTAHLQDIYLSSSTLTGNDTANNQCLIYCSGTANNQF